MGGFCVVSELTRGGSPTALSCLNYCSVQMLGGGGIGGKGCKGGRGGRGRVGVFLRIVSLIQLDRGTGPG